MGWWETDKKLTLGDTPLDVVRRALLDVAREYHEALERPPTLQELEEILRIVLSGGDGSMAEGLSDQRVASIKFSLKPQPKKQAWARGDSFCMRLPDQTYAFGRLISRHEPQKGEGIAEFFRARSKTPTPPLQFKDQGRLLGPVSIGGVVGFEKSRWRIFESDPSFRAPDHDQIRLYTGVGDNVHLFDAEFQTVDREFPRAKLPKLATDRDLYRFNDAKLEKDVLSALEKAGISAS